MTIEPDVALTAKHFGLDPLLLQAVVQAEGNIVKAVQCTYPDVQLRTEALQIVARSAVHALSDYVKQHGPMEFVAFWGSRWAPVGASNDPHSLNGNWVGNVQRIWLA